MNFHEIIGQDKIKTHLRTAARTKRPSQAYIIEGERLSGKKMIAGAFAAALLCERGGDEPCGECHSCKMAASGNHPDIIRVLHEKPNEIRVDEVRTQVAEDVSLRPYYGGYKLYLIDEAEKLGVAAQNALLKTLEDPPDYAVLMLLTTSTTRFLPTIQSRCVKLTMAPLPDDAVIDYLVKRHLANADGARLAATFARGNLGRAIALSGSETFTGMRDAVVSLMTHRRDKAMDELIAEAKRLEEDFRGQMTELLDLFVIWYRDVLLYKASGAKDGLVYREESYAIAQAAGRSSYVALKDNLQAVSHARAQMAAHVGDARVLEQLLLALA